MRRSALTSGCRARVLRRCARTLALGLLMLAALATAGVAGCGTDDGPPAATATDPTGAGTPVAEDMIFLPDPSTSGADEGGLSVEEAIARRRSVREFTAEPPDLVELSQLLWSAQGVTDPSAGYRAAPSAGALYPLTVYVAVHEARGLKPGVYRYMPERNALVPRVEGSVRAPLFDGALSQTAVEEAPVTLVLAAVFERATAKYGDRGRRYVYMEVGHAAENVYLQAAALGLGTVVIGAFEDEALKDTLRLRDDEEPLYLMPVGTPRTE